MINTAILRQLCAAPAGLRPFQIVGINHWMASLRLRELAEAGLVDAVPIRKASALRTSSKPVVRYVLGDKGRAVLAAEAVGEMVT